MFSLLTGCISITADHTSQTALQERAFRLPITDLVDDKDRTQVLVLATVHLNSLGDDFQPQYLDRLLNVLQKYNPDRIAVEHLAPVQVNDMLQEQEHYDSFLQRFGGEIAVMGKQARQTLGLNWHTALEKAQDILRQHLKNHTHLKPEERYQLIQLLLAGNDDVSATLHWLMLLESQRTSNQWIQDDWAEILNKKIRSKNEIRQIGIELATRMGLSQIDSIDDHWDKKQFMQIAPQLMKEFEAHPLYKILLNAEIYKESDEKQKLALEDKDLLPFYKYMNSKSYSHGDMDAQWGIFLRTNLESGLDRVRYSLWEFRNLRIVTHIKEVIAKHPVKRMLVIIGAAHKPFLDAYLNQLVDVKVIHLEDIMND